MRVHSAHTRQEAGKIRPIAAVWRERLPEVPPAAPVVRLRRQLDNRQALGVAVLAGIALGAVAAAAYAVAVWLIEGFAVVRSMSLEGLPIAPRTVKGAVRFVLYFALVGSAAEGLVFYANLYKRRLMPHMASRRAATRGATVAAIVSYVLFALLVWILDALLPEWAPDHFLAWPRSIGAMLGQATLAVFGGFVWFALSTAGVQNAPEGRRHCLRCNRELEAQSELQTSLAAAAPWLLAAQSAGATASSIPPLPERDSDADYWGERALFLLYGCAACGDGLLEAEAEVTRKAGTGRRRGRRTYDRWRFFSAPVPAALFAPAKAQMREVP